MRRVVINELRARRAQLVERGVTARIVKSARVPKWFFYHFLAVAYNPKTKVDNYLIALEEE